MASPSVSAANAGRMSDIDRAKGLAILLVVFGHLVARQGPAGVGWYEPLRILVYLFHMPFFMYLSGYVAFRSGAVRAPLTAWPRLARRRAERLLLPFLLFGLLILAGKLAAARLVPVDNLPPDAWHGLRALVWDTGASPATSVWYLGVLFVYSLAIPLLVRSGRFLWVIALALFVLPAPPILYADRICAYFVFFVAGGMAADAGERWLDGIDRWRWLSVASFAALLAAVAAGAFPIDFSAGTRSGAYKALMLAASLLAIPAIHGLVRAAPLAGSRMLLWLGGASFAIYLLNTICIGVAKGALLRLVSWDGANFLPFAAALMIAGTLGPVLIRRLLFRRVRVLDRLTA
jgi:fucose 4-O-acetylase-like acetyltransferase